MVAVLRRGTWFVAVVLAGLSPVALGAVPEAPDAPYAEAYRAGDYAEALAKLEEAGGTSARQLPLDWAADRAELLFLLGRGDEAIVVLRDVVQAIEEPYYTVRLAEMLRELGRRSDAEQTLQWALQQNQSRYQRQQFPRRNLLALGRLARFRGENPNRVLQIYQQRLLSRYPDFVDGFVEAGELALASYGYDVAENYFEAALALDGNHQGALVGLAETYEKAGDPRFEVIRARLEALNPRHPRLQRLVLGRTLSAGDAAASERIVEALLEINPNHRPGLAGRAAVAFLKDDPDRQIDSLARLTELDPNRGDGYLMVAEVAARRYRFAEAVALLRTGLALEPESVALRSALGLNLLRLGQDKEGREVLTAAFDQDRFNVQIYNMLEVMDTVETFATLRTPAFEIRLPAPEADVMGGEVLALLEEALERYGEAYGVSVEVPVHIQIFDDHDEFMVRSVGLPGNPGHLGICFGNLVTLDSPRARPPRTMNWRAVLWHEFVHVVTLQKTHNRIPRWLSEGISVYEEGRRDPAWGQPLQPSFAPLLDSSAWPGVSDLEDYFIRPESPNHLMLGYYLAGEFVAAYVNDFGMDALVDALDRIGSWQDASEALAGAAGADLDTLDKRFARHLSRAAKPLKYLHRDTLPAVFIPKLVIPSFPRILEAALEAERAGDLPEAIEGFERAAALFPHYPGDENPLLRLVAIHRASGDVDAWKAAVARLCENDSAAYDAPYAFLLGAAERGDWEDVVRYADWCVGIDPFDRSLYEMRRRAQEALGQHEGLLETLKLLATQDAEKAEEYRLESARVLVALDRRDEARRIVLEVLEAFPEYREAQLALLALHEAAETEVFDALQPF